MKAPLLLATLLLVATPSFARAAGHDHHPMAASALSQGVVQRVDKAKGTVTIAHGPLANLDMPAMTMSFKLKDPSWIASLKPGDKLAFLAELVDGTLTITQLEHR